MTQAIDFSYARPATQRIKDCGYVGVLRYISHSPGKNLTPAEYQAYRAAGIAVAVVFEDQAGQALAGYSQGVADALFANQYADRLGWPARTPIFYAVDTQISGPAMHATVLRYFQGATSASRRPVRGYGQASVCDLLARNGFGSNHWQTMAWSAGVVSPAAAIVQTVQTPKIVDTDVNNIVKADWGQDTYAPSPPPTPIPTPAEASMKLIHVIGPGADPTGSWYLVGSPVAPIIHVTSNQDLAALQAGLGTPMPLTADQAERFFGTLPS